MMRSTRSAPTSPRRSIHARHDRFIRVLFVPGLLVALFLSAGLSAAAQTPAFGPKTYVYTSGPVQVFDESFAASANPGATYALVVKNGDDGGGHRLSSVEVSLNGVEVVKENDFNQKVGTVERVVNVQADNAIQVRLKGGVKDG